MTQPFIFFPDYKASKGRRSRISALASTILLLPFCSAILGPWSQNGCGASGHCVFVLAWKKGCQLNLSLYVCTKQPSCLSRPITFCSSHMAMPIKFLFVVFFFKVSIYPYQIALEFRWQEGNVKQLLVDNQQFLTYMPTDTSESGFQK